MNRREAITALCVLSSVAVAQAQCTPKVAAAAVVDPLLALVNEYQDGSAVFNASPMTASYEEDMVLRAATWEPAYYRLCTNPPPATTIAGALAGIRLVLWEEETCGHHEGFTVNTLRAALAYFDGGAPTDAAP